MSEGFTARRGRVAIGPDTETRYETPQAPMTQPTDAQPDRPLAAPPPADRPLEAIVLAAGKGTRMEGERAKVLYPVADRPMIHWVLDACEAAGCKRSVVVIGYQGETVRAELADRVGCAFVEQTEQLGTGHAVMMADPEFGRATDADVVVLYGDGPLIRGETLDRLVTAHRESGAAATLATAVLEDPTGYGRIVRDEAGRFQRIVEQKDADEAERGIREINPGYYCFRAAELFDALDRIGNDNAKGEYYLTDVLEVLIAAGRPVEVVDAVPPEDVLSINTREQLEEVDRILRERLNSETAG